MSREPQRLELSTEPPNAEGIWLMLNGKNWDIRFVSQSTEGLSFDDAGDVIVDHVVHHPNARYARIAGPEE